jgi:hypothetical protein
MQPRVASKPHPSVPLRQLPDNKGLVALVGTLKSATFLLHFASHYAYPNRCLQAFSPSAAEEEGRVLVVV